MTAEDPVDSAACFAEISNMARQLTEGLPPGGREADLAMKLFGSVMGAYLTHLLGDPDHPAFLPSVGYFAMYGTPNPDTLYRNAAIDGRGRYLITGYRGTVPDVTIMAFGQPTSHGVETFAPLDLNDLTIADDGTFTVQLSAEPPVDGGDWYPLAPGAHSLMLRSVSEHWGSEVEPRVAITRLDSDPRRSRTSTRAVRQRLTTFAAVARRMVESGLTLAAARRESGIHNAVTLIDYSSGGARPGQWYHEGWFELSDEQWLLLTVELPADLQTFSLALTDALGSTLDWANAQSSLNRTQANVDADGVLRVVIAGDDPGVHNWLDTTGHPSGVLQLRWFGCAEPPDVTLSSLVRGETLPSSMTRIDSVQRAAILHSRQVGVQLRFRW